MGTTFTRMSLLALVVLTLGLGIPSGALAGGGAGEGPPGTIPVSPSAIGHLTLKVVGGNLTAEFAGRCGPLFGNETKTTKFNVSGLPIPGAITVVDFQTATPADIAGLLADGFFVDLTGLVELGDPCLDDGFAQPGFLIYGHKVIAKTTDLAVIEVVMLNIAPI